MREPPTEIIEIWIRWNNTRRDGGAVLVGNSLHRLAIWLQNFRPKTGIIFNSMMQLFTFPRKEKSHSITSLPESEVNRLSLPTVHGRGWQPKHTGREKWRCCGSGGWPTNRRCMPSSWRYSTCVCIIYLYVLAFLWFECEVTCSFKKNR